MSVELAHLFAKDIKCSLTLDEILSKLSISHISYRTYLNSIDYYMPEITNGLIDEILSLDWHIKKICKLYFLEYNKISPYLLGQVTNKGLSNNEKLDICRLRAAGTSVYELACNYNVTESRIYQITKHVEVARKKRHNLTIQDKIEISRKKHMGQSVDKLAKDYNVSVNTIYKSIREAGVML